MHTNKIDIYYLLWLSRKEETGLYFKAVWFYLLMFFGPWIVQLCEINKTSEENGNSSKWTRRNYQWLWLWSARSWPIWNGSRRREHLQKVECSCLLHCHEKKKYLEKNKGKIQRTLQWIQNRNLQPCIHRNYLPLYPHSSKSTSCSRHCRQPANANAKTGRYKYILVKEWHCSTLFTKV